MFTFFHKKVFLADHLTGFTDIHSHILPGLDDGSESLEASLGLIENFEKLGIFKVITTPHVMNDFYPNTPVTIQRTLETLQEELRARESRTEVKVAAEYMMDQAFLVDLEKEDLLTLNERLVLVEMSYFQPPMNLKEILFRINTHRYQPVLAHPERYVYYHSKDLRKYEELKSLGCRFQLNFLSLTGHYGENIKRTALQLLKRKMIDFVGTDAHQVRHLEKLQNTKIRKNQLELVLPVIENTKAVFSF